MRAMCFAVALLIIPGAGYAADSPPDRLNQLESRMNSAADKAIRWFHDSWVTVQIELRFLTNREVSVTQVRVNTRDGVVTLDGAVTTSAARTAAQEDAQRVEGVTTVVNRLQVGLQTANRQKSSSDPPGSGSL